MALVVLQSCSDALHCNVARSWLANSSRTLITAAYNTNLDNQSTLPEQTQSRQAHKLLSFSDQLQS